MSTEIVAMLSKLIFERDEFSVCEFIDAQTARRFKASGKILTLGKNDGHQNYRLFGEWQNTPKYGATFQVVYSEPVRPDSLKGIIPFLANNIKGVGEVTAKKLLEYLDVRNIDELITVCKNDSQKIKTFFKSKSHTAQQVISVITGDEIYRNIMVFLHEHNIPANFAERIFEKYGSESVNILKENPYRLISDFRNVGFLRADAIALKLGIELTSPFRLEAAFIYTLEMAFNEGHCCLPRDLLVERAADVLGGKQNQQFSFEFVLQSLRSMYKKQKEDNTLKLALRELKDRGVLFYLPEVLETENEVAGMLSMLLGTNLGGEHKEKKALEIGVEEFAPRVPWAQLSEEQRTAVETSVASKLMILTGGPGCGKTFVLKAIYEMQLALGRRVALCAPTGLAAKRMTSSIGAQASTLHKLLKLYVKTDQDGLKDGSSESSLENVDVMIIDETSMLSLELLHSVLTELGPNRRLILVGDNDQLPSIGAGNCLSDMITSEKIPVVRLTKIFRQSSESPIPLASREIITGKVPTFTTQSRMAAFTSPEAFPFITLKPDGFFDELLRLLTSTIPQVYKLDPIRDCQILVPMRRGEVGQENINKVLQEALNPAHESKPECKIYDTVFRVGDKVIQTKNNYDKEVFNGDLGYILHISFSKEKREMEIAFVDKVVKMDEDELGDLQLCYAMTVHKSQGSEFKLCIIPMFNAYYTMLDRNLLYTAVTRASKFCVVFGEEWAFKKAVNTHESKKRFTALETLLRTFAP